MKKAIVTAADTSHALSLERLVDQCAENMPDFDLNVFDLGLTSDDFKRIESKANIFKYDYDNMPAWHNVKVNAGEYAWKPVCIYNTSLAYDMVLWIDAGCFLKGRLTQEIAFCEKHGIYTSSTRGSLKEYSHPAMFENACFRELENIDKFQMRAASLLGFCKQYDIIVHNILRDWVHYALDKSVFAPEGSAKHPSKGQLIHRQDQSVFTALLLAHQYTHVGGRWNWVNQQDIDKRPRNVK